MDMISQKRRITAALIGLSLATPFSSAFAQIPGDKPIRMILPNSPGSTVDAIARTMGGPLSKALGHPVVIENLAGAGGIPGTAQLTRAAKDGLTIGMVSNNHVINPSIYKSVPYDPIKDITPISVLGSIPMVLVVHPSLPVHNAKELIALARAKPGELNYGSSGNGTILHLTAEALKNEAGGLDITHVPYRGVGPLTTDLLGGQVHFGFLGITSALPHVKTGKLRAIGLTTKSRSPILPNVLPLAEQGLPNYNLDAWIALIGPAGLPKPIVTTLYNEAKAVLKLKEVRDAMAAQGITPVGSTPDAAAAFFQTELAKHTKLVRQSGATAD